MPSLTYENDSYAPVALYPSSQRRKPKYAGLLLFSIFLSLAGTVMIPIANAQQPQATCIDFEDIELPSNGTYCSPNDGICPGCTAPNTPITVHAGPISTDVTLTGGFLYEGYDYNSGAGGPPQRITVRQYMTFGPRVGDCEELNRFSPQLGIQFSRPVSQVYLSFYGYAGNYIATDNLGNTVTVTLTSEVPFSRISLPHAGITSVTLRPTVTTVWSMVLGDVEFLPSPNSIPITTPAPGSAGGHGWSVDYELSEKDGLVLRNVKLGHRYMAEKISVPYFTLETSAFANQRGELKPNSTDTTLRSRLSDFHITFDDPQKLVIEATYLIDKIPEESESCLRITQRYEFYAATTGCEPSETMPCARFKPIVEYSFNGQNGEYLRTINIAQRNHFRVNGAGGSGVGVFQDCNYSVLSGGCIFNGGGLIFSNKINPLLTEFATRAIANGLNAETFDNYHQTFNATVDEPFLNPGCPECVHTHWRWGASVPNASAFGGGQPLIPEGSLQDLDVAVVRYHPGEEHPVTYLSLANAEAIQQSVSGPYFLPIHLLDDVVFWYSATGHQDEDSFFTHGVFYNPSFPNVTAQFNGGSVNYADMYEDGPTTATAIDPNSAGTLPNGYSLYNSGLASGRPPGLSSPLASMPRKKTGPSRAAYLAHAKRSANALKSTLPTSPQTPAFLAYDIETEAEVSGPYTVSFDVPLATDPALYNNLRVLHDENGFLLDRTILPPDPLAFDPITHTLRARVNSLGKFVIALRDPSVNQPPAARTRDITLIAHADCAATVTPGDIDFGSFDPDAGESITLSLDTTGPLSAGQHSVILMATDHQGASSSATAIVTVTVVDNQPPTITAPAPTTVSLDANGQAAIPNVIPGVIASDNCAAAGALSIVQSPAAGTLVGIGTHTITVTATDPAGNRSSATTTLTVTAAPASQLTALGPAQVWVGLKNSDDVGTKFDLLAEVFKNGTLVGSGQLNDVPGGSSGFNNARLNAISLALTEPVSFGTGDNLSIRLSVRIAASSGHRSGRARLWFNDAAANSRFTATIGGVTNTYFLRSGFTFSNNAGPGPKYTIDVLVDRAVGGNPFKPFGTWSVTF